MDLAFLKLMLIIFWNFLRESSDSCGHFMSYKVSAIIIPFCRNLLSPAMVLDFFVTSDDRLPGRSYKLAKKAMIAGHWSQGDIGLVSLYAVFF